MAHPFQINDSSFPDWLLIFSRFMAHPFQIAFPDWWFHPFQNDGPSFPDSLLLLSRLIANLFNCFQIDGSSFQDSLLILSDKYTLHTVHAALFPVLSIILSWLMPHHLLIDVFLSVCTLHPFLSRSWNLKRSSRVHFGRTTWRKWSARYKILFDIKRKCCFHYRIKLQYNLSLLTCTVHPSLVVHFVSW